MFAVTYDNIGGPEVLTFTDVPRPVPQPPQLLVKVKAAALNRADILQRKGKYPPPKGESNILGLEIAGDVVEVGSTAAGFEIGDRVFGLVGSGAYAEYCTIDAETAMIIPPSLSYLEAAAIPEAFFTADEALFTLGDLIQGESVLIHAGASGVGTAAIQLAKFIGATVTTTVGNKEKTRKIHSLNPDYVFLNEEIKDIDKMDVIIDFIGASHFIQHLDLLKNKGRLICVGLMGGAKSEINLNTLISKRLQIKGLIMRSRSIEDKRRMTYRFIEKWLPLFASKTIYPVIDSIFTINEVSAAHRRMEDRSNVGKIILEIT